MISNTKSFCFHPLAFVVGSPAAIALALVCATAVAQPYPSKAVRIVVPFVVHPSLPVKSVKDLIALAKARPGELNFASSGNGSSTHLGGLLFNKLAGVNMVHVPYKGSGPAVADLLAGQVQTRFSSIPPALPHVRTGRLRALAVTSTGRFNLLPDIPAVAESLRGFEVNSFQSGSRTLVGS